MALLNRQPHIGLDEEQEHWVKEAAELFTGVQGHLC
jgi:hypothetical protein